jgi:hypothetical protein
MLMFLAFFLAAVFALLAREAFTFYMWVKAVRKAHAEFDFRIPQGRERAQQTLPNTPSQR